MERMINAVVIRMMVGIQMLKRRFLCEERGDVNVVSIVVLIGVAVILALLFKDSISTLLGSLFNTITNTATNVVTNGEV